MFLSFVDSIVGGQNQHFFFLHFKFFSKECDAFRNDFTNFLRKSYWIGFFLWVACVLQMPVGYLLLSDVYSWWNDMYIEIIVIII